MRMKRFTHGSAKDCGTLSPGLAHGHLQRRMACVIGRALRPLSREMSELLPEAVPIGPAPHFRRVNHLVGMKSRRNGCLPRADPCQPVHLDEPKGQPDASHSPFCRISLYTYVMGSPTTRCLHGAVSGVTEKPRNTARRSLGTYSDGTDDREWHTYRDGF